ncbi:MAG TPA: M23 family metallopeptidase [Burkholderiales bacterium]|nr:M23 family metallopeptidase [Burkholderiales bacterium]
MRSQIAIVKTASWFASPVSARAAVLVALALSGVVAAFAIAPAAEPVPLPGKAALESIAIPRDALIAPPGSYVRQARFERGETLSDLLERLGVEGSQASRLIRLGTLHLLRPGTVLTAKISAAGDLVRMSYLNGRDIVRSIVPERQGFRVGDEAAHFEVTTLLKSAEIQSSLFEAADAADIPDSVAIQLADVFGGDIDFYRDLRKGDRLSVVYEMQYLGGRPVRSGRVIAAEFINKGKTFRALYYVDASGKGGYYAPDGQSLRKAFLRAPLEFSRISSRFGMRKHPFLHTWRQHRGVDYAAPLGTRVRATADGVIEFAGRKGGYGNVIILRNTGRYSTVYGHLRGFARGIHRGARVEQGEIIGFVGQTGWATGPHLHYEFRIAGVARNPLAVALPAAVPVSEWELPAFRRYARPVLAQLDLVAASTVALQE